jgi:hypothetical protein
MKRLIEDVPGGGMESLMGERITIFCAVYIYTGKLIGVNDEYVLLSDAAIVYETGDFHDEKWKDAQTLPNDWYVQKSMIESFGVMK